MITRRTFLDGLALGVAGTAMASTAKSYGQIVGANERLNVAINGLNGRGHAHLSALLASIVDDLADAGLPVTMAPPAEPVVYDCQPAGMKRLLTNLIDNAVKFGMAARAAMAQDKTEVTITIEDDGPGIPDSELARVFEPFYRIEGSRSRDTGGAGLGLAIAQSIAQSHGGRIVLANRPGGGLRASLVLPR